MQAALYYCDQIPEIMQLNNKDGLFCLIIAEIGVYALLALLVWGLWWTTTLWRRVHSVEKLLNLAVTWKGEERDWAPNVPFKSICPMTQSFYYAPPPKGCTAFHMHPRLGSRPLSYQEQCRCKLQRQLSHAVLLPMLNSDYNASPLAYLTVLYFPHLWEGTLDRNNGKDRRFILVPGFWLSWQGKHVAKADQKAEFRLASKEGVPFKWSPSTY